ncbi:MAG: hypothetical protein NW223_21985 [Hyphomicrobiaceae bacterium]|nr:hypothetical protein [Hyphomicrobiaceae bacterium]
MGTGSAAAAALNLPENGYEAHVYASIGQLSRERWTALFPDDAEGWDYYLACEASPPPAFSFSAVGVHRGGELVAAAPVFRLSYRLDTPMQGAWASLGEWLNRYVPRLVNLPVMGLGSPLADRCHLGFSPRLRTDEKAAAMRALLAALDAHAAREGVPILAVKDLAERDLAGADAALADARFTRVPSLPVAVLDLPFASEEAYLASLSPATRKDIRRKLKTAANVRVEIRTSIAGIESDIVSLYDETRAQSGFDYGDFERLAPLYFRRVTEGLEGRAAVVLYWHGEDLIGFNLLLLEPDRIIDKFIGMRYPQARDHNLYVLSWMNNVRLCLARGIRQMQTGQTAYSSKLRFGSRLEGSWVYFKHRGRVINRLFRTFGPLMAFDKMDPDLAARAKRKPVPALAD